MTDGPTEPNNRSIKNNQPNKKLTIGQNLIWNGAGATLYQGCQWLITIMVVVLSPTYENSGSLAFAMASGNVFTGLAVFNVHTYQLSDVNNKYSPSNYIAFRFLTVVIAYVLCTGYSLYIAPSIETAITVALFLLFKADECFVNVFYGIDQKASRMDFMGISQGVRGILTLACFSVGLWLTGSLPIAVTLMLLPCILVTFLYDIPHSKRLAYIGVSIDRKRALLLFRTCLPLALSALLYGAIAAFARQAFGVEFGDEALGIYAAVATPCVIVQVFARYLYAPYLVPLAEAWSSCRKQELIGLLLKSTAFMIGAILVFVALMWLFGEKLVFLIYGESIEDYAWMAVPAAIAASIMAIECFVCDVLVIVKRRIAPMLVNVFAFACCAFTARYCYMLWYMNGINIVLIGSLGVASLIGAIYLIAAINRESASWTKR